VTDDPHNVRERLARAVDRLACSAAPIQRRLADAGLVLAPLTAQDFVRPNDRRLFEGILAALTEVSDPGEGGDLAMSDERAEATARMILDLHRRYFSL